MRLYTLILLIVIAIAITAFFKPRDRHIWLYLVCIDAARYHRLDPYEYAFSMYLALALLVGSLAEYSIKALGNMVRPNPFCRLLILLLDP